MKFRIASVVAGLLSLALSPVPLTLAQTSTQTASALPRLVRFSGAVKDLNDKPLTGVVGVTFALYSEQTGGSPLWLETQNVTADGGGHYLALLGATKPEGLPAELFTSEQARWVGVQISGQPEQPRVLLVSAPYALKAGDAETIGGLPPSAFVLATPASGSAAASSVAPIARTTTITTAGKKASNVSPATATDVTTTGGTTDYLPLFNGASTIIDSAVFQTGSGSSAKIGIDTITPATTLDVHGGATVRGALSLPAEGAATAATGYTSHSFNLTASAFNSGTGKAVNQAFRWQAEPTGNDTASPLGTMNLLFAEGSASLAETGANISSNGEITGPVVNATTTFDLAGNPFAFGTLAAGNAFLGFAGNSTITGINNTAVGVNALASNTGGTYPAGSVNTATGFDALSQNTTGAANTAVGAFALSSNVSGSGNTAVGLYALQSNTNFENTALGAYTLQANTTGTDNTSTGYMALYSNTTGSDNTATGNQALFDNTTGKGNTADGYRALLLNTTGGSNTAVGYDALQFNSAAGNTAVGYAALQANLSGNANTAFGGDALYSNTVGVDNTATGGVALYSNTTGVNDTANGLYALYSNTTGSDNTAIGVNACRSNTTGSSITCTGFSTTTEGINLHNATAIGANAAVGVSDAVVLGSVAGINGATATARVGIGTTSPTNLLTLGQGFGPSIADGWTTYSSRRWKTNIKTLPSALSQVEQLRGVSYDLKENGKHEIGVIAEEVGAVVPEIVTYEQNGKDARGVDYSRLTALLIEATKEQQREIRHERTILRAQTAAIRDLKSELQVTRQTLLKIKAQVTATQPALVAVK